MCLALHILIVFGAAVYWKSSIFTELKLLSSNIKLLYIIFCYRKFELQTCILNNWKNYLDKIGEQKEIHSLQP